MKFWISKFWVSIISLIFFAGSSSAIDSAYWGGVIVQTRNLPPFERRCSISFFPDATSRPCGVFTDAVNEKLYWTDDAGNIQVVNFDGTMHCILFTDAGSLCGVAVNTATNKIYWAIFKFLIKQATLSTLPGCNPVTSPGTLYTEPVGSVPTGIAIHPPNNRIYWTNQFGIPNGQVRVACLDGSVNCGVGPTPPTTLFGTSVVHPVGVAVDSSANKIYWCEDSPSAIMVGDSLGAGSATPLYTAVNGVNTPEGIALDPTTMNIYWSNTGTSEIWTGPYTPGTARALITGAPGTNLPALLKKPLGEGIPVISGNTQVGQILSCSQGLWQSDLPGAFLAIAPSAFAYSWTLNGNIIPGATFSTFSPTVGGFYACTVTASNFAGSATQTSARVLVTQAPTISKEFIPDDIDDCGCSELVITLTNPSTVPTTLTAPLVDRLPHDLETVGHGTTTCLGGIVNVRRSKLILESGTIPAGSSCTISVEVASKCNGEFINTIPAGALQTTPNGSNIAPAFASVNFCCEDKEEKREMCLIQNTIDEEENMSLHIEYYSVIR